MKNPIGTTYRAAIQSILACGCAAIFASAVLGQDSLPKRVEGVSEALAAAQKIPAPPLSPPAARGAKSKPLLDQLTDDLRAKGIVAEWNKEKERKVFFVSTEIPVGSSTTSPEVIISRQYLANVTLGMKALQTLSLWLGTEAELEVNLSVGGSPVGELVEKDQARFRSELQGIMEELAAHQKELVKQRKLIAAAESVDKDAQRDVDDQIAKTSGALEVLREEAQNGPMLVTRFNGALDALAKKLDPAYDPAAAQSAAKEKADQLQAKVDTLKAGRAGAVSEAGKAARSKMEELQNRIKLLGSQTEAVKKKAQEALDNSQQEYLTQSFKWANEFPVCGLVPIKCYSSIEPDSSGSLMIRVAGAYAWSPAMEREISALLASGTPQAKVSVDKGVFNTYNKVLQKGDMTVSEWVATLDPFTFGPARWFIDKDGVFHIASCGIRMRGRGAGQSASRRNAVIDAETLLRFSLDAYFSDTGSREIKAAYNESDSTSDEKLAKGMLSKFKSKSKLSLDQLGIGEGLTMKLQDGSDSDFIQYVVLGVNSESMRKAYAASMQIAASNYRARLANEYRVGASKAALDFVKSADAKAPEARAAGYARVSSDLAPKPEAATPKQVAPASSETPAGQARKQSNAPVQTVIRKDTTPIPDFE